MQSSIAGRPAKGTCLKLSDREEIIETIGLLSSAFIFTEKGLEEVQGIMDNSVVCTNGLKEKLDSTVISPVLPLSALKCFILAALSDDGGFCSAPPSPFETETAFSKPLYWRVTNPTLSPSHLQDLPGFTRRVYERDHALITPESHVFSPLPEWTNTLGAFLITPAMVPTL
ncbi:hypothetical protein NC653_001676 [Populus alba x Populus x berolinensis]|uniref:Uncharacterized protein n=1 Tax=Populus alba x Populus x berolinensis TaxID=444605 RepID=A0AAD6WGU8_9ROSI|nr:hypothetical protein NC653_001676 [Populus alba x Populus x berolinensis]